MNSITRYPSALPVPFSKAVRAGGFLFLSGVLPMTPEGNIIEGDITVQAQAVLARINQILEELGASMGQVVRATVWLADLADFAAFNLEYQRHFTDGLPARSTVQCTLYRGAKVEIEVQAWLAAQT